VISKFYLGQFADEKGSLFVYEAGKPIRKSVPLRETTEKDLFEYKLPREDSRYQVEEMLSRLESLAGPIHAKLLNGVPCSNKDDILVWAFFVASTFLRSRRVRNELIVKSLASTDAEWLGNDHIRETQYEIFTRFGKLFPFDEIAEAARRARNEYENPAFRHAQAIRNSTSKLAFVLSQKHWQVVEAHELGFFATCDAPILSFQLKGAQLFDGAGWQLPNVHVALPISPRLIFLASPPDAQWIPKFDARNTALMNLVVARFADHCVYADRESSELAATLNAHARTMVFGENAFKVSQL
jgi:hypothetical protein